MTSQSASRPAAKNLNQLSGTNPRDSSNNLQQMRRTFYTNKSGPTNRLGQMTNAKSGGSIGVGALNIEKRPPMDIKKPNMSDINKVK